MNTKVTEFFMGKQIRKQVYDLTLTDLAQYPVWDFALDEEDVEGQDEATLRPLTGLLAADDFPGTVVRAKFTLADGTVLIGHMTVPGIGENSIDDFHPSIVTETSQINFLFGYTEPSTEDKDKIYSLLGKSAKLVFPIQLCSDVAQLKPPQSCKIPGFLYYKKRLFLSHKTLIAQ
jgi:hypothetical protein